MNITTEALDARLEYLMGIAERDAEALSQLQQRQEEHALKSEEFQAWKDAKATSARQERVIVQETLQRQETTADKDQQTRKDRHDALAAENEDLRLEAIAWNEAKRKAEREEHRCERESLRAKIKSRALTNENEQQNHTKEKQQESERREERIAWVNAKESYKAKEASDQRKRLQELAKSKRDDVEKKTNKKKTEAGT